MGSNLTKQKDSTPQQPVSPLEIPINSSENEFNDTNDSSKSTYPTPQGDEYDLIDDLAAQLPSIIDDESRRQVDEYIAACDDGNGPAVACFSTAEYLSLFERKHREAMKLYENTCHRPSSDRSPNVVDVDGTKAYPPSCYNLARFRMTGKGRTKFDRKEGYELFDRACRGGHDPACFMQGKMLTSHPGSLGEGVPYDPYKAMDLFEKVCNNRDSFACFTLGTMLLRGDAVDPAADNVSPQEARGEAGLKKREGEKDRRRKANDERAVIERDPPRAEKVLLKGCEFAHAPSCFNLAVMYNQGDDGVPPDQKKAEEYQKRTEELVKMFGGFGSGPI